MIPRTRHFTAWLLALAIALAITLAFADPVRTGESLPVNAEAPSADAQSAVSQPADSGALTAFATGLTANAGGAEVPAKWLPPGSFSPDQGPSTAVFPPQKMTLRFNHKFHIAQGAKCQTCHKGALTSESVSDHLIPNGETCDTCHGTDHTNLSKVVKGDDESGQCNFCHLGYKAGDGNTVAKLVVPRANMRFNHKKHVTRNIACEQCHGEVAQLELATRDQLPRMRGCFSCHQMTDATSQGEAKGACETCHLKGGAEGTRIKTMFASGEMKPPRWMHNAGHSADFIQRHKMVAANDSQFCANCHKEDFCVGCHDGRVRPRSIHPNDYISMHPIEARLATQRCTSCHKEQNFCLGCHQRVGVSMSGPPNAREAGRFHPPKQIWSDAPRKPGHHSQEAMRNLNACVGCHVERDCVVCHGGQGIGGGFNPHMAGFANGCATQFKRNPRPCLVCHEPGAGALNQCR